MNWFDISHVHDDLNMRKLSQMICYRSEFKELSVVFFGNHPQSLPAPIQMLKCCTQMGMVLLKLLTQDRLIFLE